jgi:hypothetical protein
MSTDSSSQSTSTELSGGAGFNYEDLVVGYYLAALLSDGPAAGVPGIVRSVAVQQAAVHPMDDLVVELEDQVGMRVLGLQIKRPLRITAAASNTDFRKVLDAAVATRKMPSFQAGRDVYGFIAEHVAVKSFRSFSRLIDWARVDVSGADFRRRFEDGGSAATAERQMRTELLPLIDAQTADDEHAFYRDFVALRVDGLSEGGIQRAGTLMHLQSLIADEQRGMAELLFNRLCHLASEGAGRGQKWNRLTLLQQLRGVMRLRGAPSYFADLARIQRFSSDGMADILDTIGGHHIDRPSLHEDVSASLAQHRLVNLTGLPGCGKSVVLKQSVKHAMEQGPTLFIKSDRLMGNSWSEFAAMLGLQHPLEELLAEIGSSGTPILFIDGIDRVRPDQKGVITDLLRTIETKASLGYWRVLATSRDQGMEPYRAWFPASFYQNSGIGDIAVQPFTDEEAAALATAVPALRSLLISSTSVKEIVRRPFFAAVLATDSVGARQTSPQTEIDLIAAWWSRAGYDSGTEAADLRRRAIIDLAETGVRELGKNIRVRKLQPSTVAQLASLKTDLVIRDIDEGAAVSFTHDIYFEWAFYRLLIDLGRDWHDALGAAGEPPLLSRVVGLLAQQSLMTAGQWTQYHRLLEDKRLRPQWTRAWLTAPPFTGAFLAENIQAEFASVMRAADYRLLDKLLVWFQAEHTIPNPVILQRSGEVAKAEESIRMAHLLGWPSDVRSWGRLIDWLMSEADRLPGRLIPKTMEVFEVWLNMFATHNNLRTAAIVAQSSRWLQQLESADRADAADHKWDELGREATEQLTASLRRAILRCAPILPGPAIELYVNARAHADLDGPAYHVLMAYAFNVALVAPEAVVALVKSAVLEELPGDRYHREAEEQQRQMERRAAIRAIPEAERTRKQQHLLDHSHFLLGQKRPTLDYVGILEHHSFYTDPSAMHEPFASLFTHAPAHALALINDMANHAVTGWRQVHAVNAIQTPLSVVVQFPWGEQTFWGDWHVYSWSQGQLAAAPLACAFLSLSHWAFQALEQGRDTDDVIRQLVQGSECIASLGVALVIALEKWHVSTTTLALVGCQRLWQYDIQRMVQAPTLDIDILGLGLSSRLTGSKAVAQDFLKSRQSRTRNVQQLAAAFAVTSDAPLRVRFREMLASFPRDLPFETEEDRKNNAIAKRLLELATQWSGQGDKDNYRRIPMSGGGSAIAYESPVPLDLEQQARLAEANDFLHAQWVLSWATQSLESNALQPQLSLASAIAFAKERDASDMFEVRYDVGAHAVQSSISGIAACVIRFDKPESTDTDWAWSVMERVWGMQELQPLNGSRVPWHPFNHLITALVHQRRTDESDDHALHILIELTAHPLDDISKMAFTGLLRDEELAVTWIAAQLAMRMATLWRPEWKEDGHHDHSKNQNNGERSRQLALEGLSVRPLTPFPAVPPAWEIVTRASEDDWDESDTAALRDPDPSFDWRIAAKIFGEFPVERWCMSEAYRDSWQSALGELTVWSAARLMPAVQTGRRRHRPDCYEWNITVADLIARSAALLDEKWSLEDCLKPFLADDNNALQVLSWITKYVSLRHVVDADEIRPCTLRLLEACAERLISDLAFSLGRDGAIYGDALPRLVEALLFVTVEKAQGARRFANGDWSQIELIMPLVTKVVSAIGWASYVMEKFLVLCERAGEAYPLDLFIRQVTSVLESLDRSQGSWIGTTLPARLAATVQRLADHSYPLQQVQSLGLLRILDSLIDLGDRRSAALEQSEAFRKVQKID